MAWACSQCGLAVSHLSPALVPVVFLALRCDACDVVKTAKDVLGSAGGEPVSDSELASAY